MELNNIIFLILLIVSGYYCNKYILFVVKKKKYDFLLDKNFRKPQAFHQIEIPRTGGILIFSLFILSLLYLFFF